MTPQVIKLPPIVGIIFHLFFFVFTAIVVPLIFIFSFGLGSGTTTRMNCVLQADNNYTCQASQYFFDKIKTWESEETQDVTTITVNRRDNCRKCGFQLSFLNTDRENIHATDDNMSSSKAEEMANIINSQMAQKADRIDFASEVPVWLWWVEGIAVGFFVILGFVRLISNLF